MSETVKTAKVQLSWTRRQWLKVAAMVEDHPRLATLALASFVAFILFYGIRLGGFSHFIESGARWRLETFGGSHHVDRSVRTPDLILSLKLPDYDRLDVTSPTASHLGGTAFREELRSIVQDRNGKLRINVLDPRLAEKSDDDGHERFESLAKAYGITPRELGARCWHSVAVLLHLEEELGNGIEIRLISEPIAAAIDSPYFSIGRSGHAYISDNPKKRLDVIVPRPATPTFSDSFTHPGEIIVNRPKNAEVIRFTEAFKTMWETSTPLDEALRNEFRAHLDE